MQEAKKGDFNKDFTFEDNDSSEEEEIDEKKPSNYYKLKLIG